MKNSAEFPTSAREKLRAGFAAGHRRPMVTNPTGGEKKGSLPPACIGARGRP
jgi:hypothetical protein